MANINPWVGQDANVGMPLLVRNAPAPIAAPAAPKITREPAGKGKITRTVEGDKSTTNLEYGTHKFETAMDEDKSYFTILNALESKKEDEQIGRQRTIDALRTYQQSIADNTTQTLAESPSIALDLKPLAAYVDAQTGSNLAASVNKPLDLNDRMKLLQNVQDKVTEQKEKMISDSQSMEELKLKVNMERESNRVKNEMSMQMLGGRLFQTEQQGIARANAANGPQTLTKLSQKTSLELAGNEEARALIQDFISYVKANPSRLGALAALKSFDPSKSYETADVQEMVSKFNFVKQRVGKILEGGVLREGDWKKYNLIIGSIYSNPQVALNRLRDIDYDMHRAYITDINALTKSKYDTSGWVPGAIKGQKEANARIAKEKADKYAKENPPKAGPVAPGTLFNLRNGLIKK